MHRLARDASVNDCSWEFYARLLRRVLARSGRHYPFGHYRFKDRRRTISLMSETTTVIVWSLYVWLGSLPSYDIQHKPIFEQSTKLVGEYATHAQCEEERAKQAHVARCIRREIERK